MVFPSSLSLKSEPTHDWPKLCEAFPVGVQLLEQRFPNAPPNPLPSEEAYYQLLSRDQSSDGSVTALNSFRTCRGGVCAFVELSTEELRAPGRSEPLKREGAFVSVPMDFTP